MEKLENEQNSLELELEYFDTNMRNFLHIETSPYKSDFDNTNFYPEHDLELQSKL